MTSNNLHLPRILCLHGGGVSSQIFTLQCRTFISALSTTYRLIFADAPFLSTMHPDLVPVYGSMSPTYRWSPWLSSQQQFSAETAREEIEYACRAGMARDDAGGGTGEWVGLMGFSQGGQVVMSVLLENQARAEKLGVVPSGLRPEQGFAGANWRFGVVMAGRAPPHSFSELTAANPFFSPPGRSEPERIDTRGNTTRLEMFPTLHVHGLQDEGLELHRELFRDYVGEGMGEVIEWEAGHRVMFRMGDVERVVEWILRVGGGEGRVVRSVEEGRESGVGLEGNKL